MPRTTVFEEAELPPALESRVPVYLRCSPAGSKQFVQFAREPIEVLVVTAYVEILESVFTSNQVALVRPDSQLAANARQTSLHERFNTYHTVMSRRPSPYFAQRLRDCATKSERES
jgi:hypothetical protein